MAIRITLKDALKIDENSLGLLFDVDGVEDPQKIADTIDALKGYLDRTLSFWDFIAIIITIWRKAS